MHVLSASLVRDWAVGGSWNEPRLCSRLHLTSSVCTRQRGPLRSAAVSSHHLPPQLAARCLLRSDGSQSVAGVDPLQQDLLVDTAAAAPWTVEPTHSVVWDSASFCKSCTDQYCPGWHVCFLRADYNISVNLLWPTCLTDEQYCRILLNLTHCSAILNFCSTDWSNWPGGPIQMSIQHCASWNDPFKTKWLPTEITVLFCWWLLHYLLKIRTV